MGVLTALGAAQETEPVSDVRCEAERPDLYRVSRLADLGEIFCCDRGFPQQERVTTMRRDRSVALWDTVTGARVAELYPLAKRQPRLIDRSPSGDVMIWAGPDGVVAMRDTRSGAVISEPPALRSAPPPRSDRPLEYSMIEYPMIEYPITRFSADGSKLGVRTVQKSLALLDGRTGEQIGEEIPDVDAMELHFSSDGRLLVAHQSDPRDGGGGALEAATGRHLRVRVSEWSDDVHFNSEGTRALVLRDTGWTLIDPAGGQELARGEGVDGEEEDASFVGHGAFVLAEQGRRARLIDVQTGRLLAGLGELAHSNEWIEFGLQFAPDRRSAVARAPDGSTRLWDLTRGGLLAELGVFTSADASEEETIFTGHPQRTGEFRYSADGARLITHAKDGRVGVWDARTGRIVRTFTKIEPVDAYWVSPGGRFILIAADRRRMTLWDSRTGSRIADLGVFSPVGAHLDFSPDERALLISDDRSMELWDLERRRLLLRRAGDFGGDFSGDGALLALRSKADLDGEFELWNVRTGARTATIDPASHVAFMRAGNRDILIAHSVDVVAFWDVRRGEKLLHCSANGLNLNLDEVMLVRNGLSFILRRGFRRAELWRIEPRPH
jgi:WD40 repeat protein